MALSDEFTGGERIRTAFIWIQLRNEGRLVAAIMDNYSFAVFSRMVIYAAPLLVQWNRSFGHYGGTEGLS